MKSKTPSPSVRPFAVAVPPAWVAARSGALDIGEAAFSAGAGLLSLDTVVRAEPVWAGAWRQRQALKCAVAAVRLIGRREDEAALRDAWLLRRPDDGPGPAGDILSAYRKLAGRAQTIDIERLREIVLLLGLRWGARFGEIPDMLAELLAARRPAPFAAAACVAEISAMDPGSEILGWWLADWVLAQSLRWPRPVPLLMAERHGAAFRGAVGSGRIRPGAPGFERAVCVALTEACLDSCRLAAVIDRRAERLIEVAPKLRAKGAGDVIALLLDDDAVSGGLQTLKLSRWASRRLFERLVFFDAVRELSGRDTFRIYGL